MTNSGILTILRALTLCLSFIGLSALLRVRFRLHACIAPFVAACCAIIIMMLGGMAGMLKASAILVYISGFVGLIYARIVKKQPLQGKLIAAMLAYIAILTIRFYPTIVAKSDDLAHWALAARHMLKYDAFPTPAAEYILYPSYPLGSACFMYLAEKIISGGERVFFIAHNFLLGVLFLPVFSISSASRRKYMFPFALALFICLFHYSREVVYMTVDLHLAFFGIGAAACAVHYRNNLKQAMISMLPAMVTLVFFKNSGIFFSVICAGMLAFIIRRRGASRKRALLAGGICAAVPAAAYGLWSLYTKLRFPAVGDSMHAVSLSAYAGKAAAKSGEVILASLENFLKCLFMDLHYSQLLAIMILMFIGVILLVNRKKAGGRRLMAAYWASLGAYFLWLVMLFATYIFSMTVNEALTSAQFTRYNSTGLSFLLGCGYMLLALWAEHCEENQKAVLSLCGHASRLAIIMFVCFFAVCTSIPKLRHSDFYEDVFARTGRETNIRQALINAHEKGQLEEGGKYYIFCRDTMGIFPPYGFPLRAATYELMSHDLAVIVRNTRDAQYKRFATRNYSPEGSGYLSGTTDDPREHFDAYLPGSDAVILLCRDEGFEKYLTEYMEENSLDIPIVYAE